METTTSTTNSATQNKTGVKLTFRKGEKGDLISTYERKIAIIDRSLKDSPVVGISYTCELKPMMKGNGYIVVAFEKTPTIKANLVFKRGKKMYNERTGTNKENMVSTYNREIVIAPEDMKLDTQKEYACELVMSPNGRAYIVETATPATPAKVEIVSHDYPVFSVEVKIGGVANDDLRFDCSEDDEKTLEHKMYRLSCLSIIDKEMVLSNYKASCEEIVGKYRNQSYKNNKDKF